MADSISGVGEVLVGGVVTPGEMMGVGVMDELSFGKVEERSAEGDVPEMGEGTKAGHTGSIGTSGKA